MASNCNDGGLLFLVSAPSGAGKTSLVRALMQSLEAITVSVSHTTRAPRAGERDGREYHFVDRSRFEQMAAEGRFLEHAQVFDHFYGTSRDAVLEQLRRGVDVILEIDWQGAAQVRERMPAQCTGVFILPPSRAALESRLRGRDQDPEAVIRRRMRDAVQEMSHFAEYDYLVVNDDFDQAVAELRSIVLASRLRTARQTRTRATLIAELMA